MKQTRKRNSKIICYFTLTRYNYDGEHTRVREGGSEGGEEVKEGDKKKKGEGGQGGRRGGRMEK